MTANSVDNLAVCAVDSPELPAEPTDACVRMVVGVTSAQTCLVLTGRMLALRRAGFAVTVVSSPGDLLGEIAEREGVEACAVSMARGIAPWLDIWSLLKLIALLRRVRPGITDFSTPKAGLLGNLAACWVGVPCRVYTLRGLKLEGTRGLERRLLLWVERITAWCAHRVLCNSPSLREEAVRLGIASGDKLWILGDGSSNGVDVDRFRPNIVERRRMRTSLGFAEDALVFGFVGRLTKDKGIPELLVAFEDVLKCKPECWLLLVGWFDQAEDALGMRCRRRIEGHPRIRCTGFVKDTLPYYCAMDVFVLPTHREGFPNAVLEASSCGLPVITTESTGARDAVMAEVTGLVIPPGYAEAIAGAMLRLALDSATRRQMGNAGRTWVVERYSRERVLSLATEFYREMVQTTAV